MTSKVGAIYSVRSKLLQRIYVPDAEDDEIDRQYIGAGEALMMVPLDIYRTGGAVALQSLIGEPTSDGYCAVIDKESGEIIERVIWDIELHGNKHPDGHLIVPIRKIE